MLARLRDREGGGEVGGDMAVMDDTSNDNFGENDTGDKSGAQSIRFIPGWSFDGTVGGSIRGVDDDVMGAALRRFISSVSSRLVMGLSTGVSGDTEIAPDGFDDLNNLSAIARDTNCRKSRTDETCRILVLSADPDAVVGTDWILIDSPVPLRGGTATVFGCEREGLRARAILAERLIFKIEELRLSRCSGKFDSKAQGGKNRGWRSDEWTGKAIWYICIVV
jgi:hypothetical protein